MLPMVVLMIFQLFIPLLENFRSEEIDATKMESLVEFEKNIAIIESVISLTLGVYFFYVTFIVWYNIETF